MLAWQGISEFTAVAETASFTLGAKQLGLSTAQVSRQINTLEARLGCKLFYRTTRQVSLTAEGQLYLRHCRQILDGLAEAEQALNANRAVPHGHLKVTAPVTYGEQFVMPLLHDFMAQYPELSVTMVLSNQTLDLIEGGFDLAVRLGRLASSSTLVAKRLASRQQFVCAAPSYLQRFGTPHTLAELRQHQCLIGNHDHWHFQEQGKARAMQVAGRLRCNSGIALRDAALKGLGIVQLPDYYVADDIAAGQLVTVLDAYQQPEEGIWALFPQNRYLSPKVRMLVDFLAVHLNGVEVTK
ncbi:LysR substrate-binding domain-containing protein [Pseudoalteromonas fenneropenaei]|uniref:LysR substrate-binding domain-containing protein n=1 Tax=Pseudoalteromonas fenneropenaei TaxID=1737459 RepID=A0ABV7CPI3_9GAMM